MILHFTFDDGPHRWTPALLDALKEYDSTATFFVLGCHALAADDVLKRTADEGHAIGVHGWGHTPWTNLSDEELRHDLDTTIALIEDVTGTRPWLYRPPHHAGYLREDRIAESRALSLRVGPGYDPGDWMLGKTAESLYHSVLAHARDGQVVNWHDGMPPGGGAGSTSRAPTVGAVRGLLHSGVRSTRL